MCDLCDILSIIHSQIVLLPHSLGVAFDKVLCPLFVFLRLIMEVPVKILSRNLKQLIDNIGSVIQRFQHFLARLSEVELGEHRDRYNLSSIAGAARISRYLHFVRQYKNFLREVQVPLVIGVFDWFTVRHGIYARETSLSTFFSLEFRDRMAM